MVDEDETPQVEDRWLRALVLAVLCIVVLGGAIDLYLDGPEQWGTPHTAIEVALMAISGTAGILLWRAWRRTARTLGIVERSLSVAEQERGEWQARAEQALSGMARAIDDQFGKWELTPAEREVALMLLKGYGHKQIAYRTNRSESTVRQHAVAVYGKSGQAGRAELSAFFLDGLMLPERTTPAIAPDSPSGA